MKSPLFSRRITILLIILFCAHFSSPLRGDEVRYSAVFDLTLSSRSGAENLVSGHKLIFSLQEKILPPSLTEENTALNKSAGIAYRLAKAVILDNVANHLTYLVQHEVFGHGARYREFGYQNIQYELHLFFPWGSGRGWTRGRGSPSDRWVTGQELMMAATGGVEANSLLARRLRINWMLQGQMTYGESMLYLYTANDLLAYIWRTKWKIRGPSGNDILHWITRLNSYEGYFFKEDYPLTLNDLCRHSWANILSPFNYLALYSLFVPYLWNGEIRSEIPMIRMGDCRYLPSLRIGLTPYGTEFIQENYIKKGKRLHILSLRIGESTFHRFWGMGWECLNLLDRKLFRLDSRIDFWNQPELMLGKEDGYISQSGWGVSAVVTGHLKNIKPLGIGVLLELGYKTAGFLEGEPMQKGIVFRMGLTYWE